MECKLRSGVSSPGVWLTGFVVVCALGSFSKGVAQASVNEIREGPDAAKYRQSEPTNKVRTLQFSAEPTDTEIRNARVFDDTLVPMDDQPRTEENRALAGALTAYAARTTGDDCSSLAGYAENFPDSRWTGPLLLHLGTEYYNYGYFSKALNAWERAWARLQGCGYGPAKPEADRALGELARLYSRLGRMTELGQLLDPVKGRDLAGPGTQLIHEAQEALWLMRNRPDYSFGCGPSALDRILLRLEPAKAGNPLLLDCKSGTNGFSLVQVVDISRRLGMNYQMAFREPGTPLIVPAVVHWKVDHYAALTERRGDRILSQDPTFRGSVWITTRALDQEASGYFLVPPGPLPKGWRQVAPAEGQWVRGKGVTGGKNGHGTTPCDHKSGGCGGKTKGMATYSMHTMLVSLTVEDTPVGYRPPLGPMINFTVDYHQLEADQPANFYYANLGPKWTCGWISYITDNPNSPTSDVALYVDGGGTFDFTGFNPTTSEFSPEVMSQTLLIRTSSSSYELQYADGSLREFTQSDGSVGSTRRVFLTQVIDPRGHAIRFQYDPQLRITNVVDAIGQRTTLSYTNGAYPLAITAVVDPFGRAANLQYDTNGLLTEITDTLGLTSQLSYGSNQFITALTTPYGTTKFTTGSTNGGTYLMATDPEGETELLEYSQSLNVPHSLPASEVPHGLSTFNLFIDARDSFFWDKRAYAEGAWDWTKARIFHWLHETSNGNESARILESQKSPLEGRIWYNYPGQSTNFGAPYYLDAAYTGASDQPSVIARVLDDGTTQLSTYSYNSMGNLTNLVDPLGRTFSFVYATNNIDLLGMLMTRNGKNELLASAVYNPRHQPLTVTDAAGQATTFTYNFLGLIQTLTKPNGALTIFTYDTNGYLLRIDGPVAGTNDSVSFTYDAVGRVHTASDTEGYTVTYTYDNLDRVVLETYPDGTSDQVVYDRLDVAAVRDRLGRWTTNTFNSIHQLLSVQDHLNRITRFNWCKCGALASITDPLGRTTSWTYDVQGRPVAKTYADGSTETVTYENATSRIHSRQDEAGQLKVVEYYPDNNLKQVSFVNALVNTPTVSFSYDPDYNRVLTMKDGVGTTTYNYYPISTPPQLGAGKLASAAGPLPNSLVTYAYDSLGRITNRNIAGANFGIAYDALNRPVLAGTPLGIFGFTYVNATRRPASLSYPNGQTNLFSYYDNVGDQRLKQILNLKPDGSLLSALAYGYNPIGLITALTNQWDTLPTRVWQFAYDADNELTNAVRSDGISPPVVLAYAYDAAGNRILTCSNAVQTAAAFNALNQLIAGGVGPATSATYEWDAEKRLVAINHASHRSEFSYDGLSHRVRVVEKTNGVVAADNYLLWADATLSEVRDSTGSNVLRRLSVQGESTIGSSVSNYYYTLDHLGSLREMTDSQGRLISRYDYDPYGQRTVLLESLPATVAFTGHYFHAPSGLNLALFRALDSGNARWLSRDPLGEQTGLNLYGYVGNNPLSEVDRYGLECENVISEETFQTATYQKQVELDESSAKWGPLSPLVAPFAAVATDGAFFGMNDITFRGDKMLGGNLNYYTQGQVWSTYGAPKSIMIASIYIWKAVVYRSLPAEVDLRLAREGYDCHRFVSVQEEFRQAKTMPLPKGLSMTAAPPSFYSRVNNATGGFLEWLGDNTGLW